METVVGKMDGFEINGRKIKCEVCFLIYYSILFLTAKSRTRPDHHQGDDQGTDVDPAPVLALAQIADPEAKNHDRGVETLENNRTNPKPSDRRKMVFN